MGKTAQANGNTLPLEPHSIAILLYGVHHALSQLLEQNIPVAQRVIPLEQDDASKLSEAVCKAARHFPMMAASQKMMDISTLIIVAASIYLPMAFLYMQRLREQPRAAPTVQPTRAPVFNTRPTPAPAAPPVYDGSGIDLEDE